MLLTSAAFGDGDAIPRTHSREGTDSHPPLAWSGVPESAKSLALVCDDPDAPRGTWVHWVLYDLPPTLSGIAAGVAKGARHDAGGTHGTNDFDELGWGGPEPPRGHGVHRYVFRLYALDAPLRLAAGASKADLEKAMEGRVLAQARLTGTYRRD